MNTQDNGAKSTLLTPGNVITAIILLVGLFITVLRFTKGIGSVTALDDNNPWGIWISFDLLCGVVLAAGGYTTTSAYYLFGLKQFRSAVRPAITSAFLGYAFVVFALHYDVGQPWRLVYPIFVSQGTTSILFEVGLCVFLYVTVLAIEFSPAVWEWLGIKRLRSLVLPLTIPLTILGVILSTMHQSSLGALYLIAPSKMHPLWYSSFIPVFFMDTLAGVGFQPTHYVDITEQIETKLAALRCHRSQLDWMLEHDNIDFADMVRTCSKYRGYQCGAAYAEGFRPYTVYPRMAAKNLLP